MAYQEFAIEFKGYWREEKVSNIPSESGVYCVYECTHNEEKKTVSIHKLIYIGESCNVNERITKHEKREDWKKHVRPGNVLCFNFAYVESNHRDRVEAALIYKHKPLENVDYKYNFPFDDTKLEIIGQTALLFSNFTVVRRD
jgi:excinuclease UvrABC nuclease subunit